MKRLLTSVVDQLIPVASNRRMLFRALREVSRHPSAFTRRFNATNLRFFLTYRRHEFNCNICGNRARPLYEFPDIALRIEHKIGVLRETLQCSHCLASMRQRSLAFALLEHLNSRWSTQFGSISDLADHGLRGIRVLDTDNFSHISTLMREVPGYTRCSYIPSIPWGARLEANYYNEDIQSLSFPDEAFDIVLTSDVMEHVRDCDSAHREIHRVLVPGGAYIFNVPFDSAAATDIQLVDTSTPEDIHLCEPQYHGDPLSGGVLAYRVFGRSLIARLELLGFEVEFLLVKRPSELVIDGDVFLTRKKRDR